MLEEGSRVPVYLRLAAVIREQIIAGELLPGAAVPSEPYLSAQYGVSRQSVRTAIAVLREQGWVVTHRSRGSVVLPVPPLQVLEVAAGDVIRARLPVPGDPDVNDVTLIVRHPDGREETRPAARTIVRVTGPDGDHSPAAR